MKSLLKKPPFIKYLVALAICSFYFLFHFHYMQQYLDYDQVWYLDNIIRSCQPLGRIDFNPHHLHVEIGGKIYHDLIVNLFGKAGMTDVNFNVRLRSLFVACLGIFFLLLFLEEITGKLGWAVVGSLLIAFCHGFLAYSTQVDTAIFPVAGIFGLLWILLKIERAKRFVILLSFLAGFILYINMMYHQYMAIPGTALVVSLLLPPALFSSKKSSAPFAITKPSYKTALTRNPKIRYLAVLIIVIISGSLTVVSYYFVGKVCYNLPYDKADTSVARGPYYDQSFQRWLFFYEARKWWSKGFRYYDPRHSFRGLTNGFLSPTGYKYIRFDSMRFKYNLRDISSEESFVYNQIALLQFIAFLGTIFFIFPLWRRYKQVLIFILLNLLIFWIFITYWEALYFEFWLIPNGLICILCIFVLNMLGEKLAFFIKKISHIPLQMAVLFLIIGLASHNILYYVIPYSQVRQLEDIDPKWPEWFYMKCFSTYIYRYPHDPYKNIKTMEAIR